MVELIVTIKGLSKLPMKYNNCFDLVKKGEQALWGQIVSRINLVVLKRIAIFAIRIFGLQNE